MSNWEGRLVFHVDADAFFASVEQVTNPALRGKPVVVCGHPFRHGVVTAASYEARSFGVKAGMPNQQAKNLLPQGHFIPVNIPKYLHFSLQLLAVYLRWTPRVEAYSVDEVFMDLTGESKDPTEIARQLKKEVQAVTGLSVSIGVASNKLVAKIASDFQKPDGLTVIRPEEIPEFLGPLDVGRCPGIGSKTLEILKQMGIETFSQLLPVPEAKLKWLFGKNGEKLYQAARGIDHSAVVPLDRLPPLKSKGQERTFEEPLESVDQVKAVIRELSGRIALALREKNLLAKGVRLKLKMESGPTVTAQCQLGLKTTDEQIIANAAFQLYFRRYAGKLLRGIGVCAIGLITVGEDLEQLKLFGAENHLDSLQPVIDRLKQKYGEGIIFPAVNLLNRNHSQPLAGEEPWAGF